MKRVYGINDQRAVQGVRLEPAVVLKQRAKRCCDLPVPISLVA